MLTTRATTHRGQATLEAILVIPFLLLIIFGIFVFGQWFNATQIVTAAAREGARVGAQTPYGMNGEKEAAIGNAVFQNMKILDTRRDVVRVECRFDKDAAGGDYLTVAVTYCIPLRFAWFEKEYSSHDTNTYDSKCTDNSNTKLPFTEATGQAVARMEASFDATRECSSVFY